MLDLLDEMSELVYIADLNTYDLLFLNKPGRDMFGVEKLSGQKCYQVLQNRQEPCDFCNNAQLAAGMLYTWEFTNSITGRHYLLKDQITHWKGRPARLEIAFDITDYENQRVILQNMLASEMLLLECVKKLHRAKDLDATVNEILAILGEHVGAERIYIFRINEFTMDNTHEWCAEGIEPEMDHLQEMDLSLLQRWIPDFLHHRCVVIEDLEQIKEISPEEYFVLQQQNIHSLVAVPLESEEKLTGYIGVDNPPADKIESIANLLNTLGYFLVSSIQKTENEKKLLHLSYFDTLTGLYNRNRFMQDIDEIAKQLDQPLGVVYVDINGLKNINDRFGHKYGDHMIVSVVQKIQLIFSKEDIYRVGGDEFVILCHQSQEQFERNVRDLKNQFLIKSECRASIGYSWSPSCSFIQTQITDADEMMYGDKKLFYHKNPYSGRYRYYNDDVLGLTVPGALEKAIQAGRFLICYQPKIACSDRSLIGAEALVRYRVTGRDVLSPDKFIPVLEDARLISQIDFYVYDQVCRQVSDWIARGKPVVPVSVNFSRYTLLEPNFISTLHAIWQAYSFPQRLVEIEITEGGESEDNQKMMQMLNQVKASGFVLSIDDFGAKYANLSLFTGVNFDVLKVDKSLIVHLCDNQKTQHHIQFSVQICNKMDVQLIAEGVESENQFAKLQDLGCHGVQGFLFSRPLTLAVFESQYGFL